MIKGLKVWIGGWWWLRYCRTTPGKVPPQWACRWVMAGTSAQRLRLADRIDRAGARRRARSRDGARRG